MAHARQPRDQPAHGLVRAGCAAGRRSDDHERPLPVTQVTLYHAAGCHLCTRALDVVREVHDELEFDLELVDVGGEPELEARYRESLPVVEIDGERVFTYFVDAEALRRRLSR